MLYIVFREEYVCYTSCIIAQDNATDDFKTVPKEKNLEDDNIKLKIGIEMLIMRPGYDRSLTYKNENLHGRVQ